jgi:hypothetical protein
MGQQILHKNWQNTGRANQKDVKCAMKNAHHPQRKTNQNHKEFLMHLFEKPSFNVTPSAGDMQSQWNSRTLLVCACKPARCFGKQFRNFSYSPTCTYSRAQQFQRIPVGANYGKPHSHQRYQILIRT